MTQLASKFINQYPVSKSIRFELVPIAQTEANIKRDRVLEKDNKKAKYYEKVKKIIDDFHRDFIEKSLSGFYEQWEELENATNQVKKADKDKKELQKELAKIQNSYRQKIVIYIKENTPDDYQFTDITSAPLVKTILKKWLKDDDEIELLKEFSSFDGYFTGLHQTRKNIYSDKAQTTALAYRIVHDNFAKFLNNFAIYQKHFDKIKNYQNTTPEAVIEKIDNFFKQGINAFNTCLSQNGIDNFNNNIAAPIKSLTNSYRQQTKEKIPFMKDLFKQILSINTEKLYFPTLENDAQVINAIGNYQQSLQKNKALEKLETIINNLAKNEYDLSKIYWQHDQLTNLSRHLFNDWHFIDDALTAYYEKEYPIKNQTQKKKQEKWQKQNFSIKFLQQAIDDYCHTGSDKKPESIIDYWQQQSGLLNIKELNNAYLPIANKLKDKKEETLTKDSAEQAVKIIKDLLDNYLKILWLFKPLMPKKTKEKDNKDNNIIDQDAAFYGDLEPNYEALAAVIPLYNLVRNYITQKPYSTEKIKLNFENPTLADGWDINKEIANTSIILKRGALYYLAIMNKKETKVFQNAPKVQADEACYQKLNYKLLSGAKKMLPKVFFSKKGIETFEPSQVILDLYKNEEHKKGNNFSTKSCHQLIDFFKANISKYKVNPEDKYGWDVFAFNFSPTNEYEDISQFYKEVEQQGYKIWFSDIPKAYIDECISTGKLYLFQLYNKDFSTHSKGKENLHTLYWRALFSSENIKHTIYKLNGEAELFHRKKSVKTPITHPKNKKIKNKTKEGYGLFKYDLTKDKRYTEDKYFFHVPITINFKARSSTNFNQSVQTFLKNNKAVNIIGIDRGEKNLIYYSIIDQKGKIIKQDSFNIVNGTNYHQLLDKAQEGRDKARKDWKTIGKIKDLKSGYLSQVIHNISQLMLAHNAIVVMEDLNFGFKNSRKKIEKQVYQNLEKALINKLNYLAFKDKEIDELGSIRHGLQLSAPFESFTEMGKQTGFIFYVPAAYTSKIDFQTGFAPFKYFKHETTKKSKNLMQGITHIKHDNNCFIMAVDYAKLDHSQPTPQNKWQLYLDSQERWKYEKKKNQKVMVYEKLKSCFLKNNISLEGNIANHIIKANKASVYITLFKYLNLVSQMRFTSEQGEDYILSPIKGKNGKFFRTKNKEQIQVPKDSDANGAYHIALKGLYMLHHKINKGHKNLFIKNEEWFEYTQKMAQKRPII